MDGKEFQALVEGARSYRRYSGEAVPREELLALIDAARFAPTGNNTQLLRFHMVSGKEDPAEARQVFSHLHWAAALKDWDGPEPGERPSGYIAVCLPTSVSSNPVRLLDVGIAAQTLSLAAASLGLGCCMVKSFDACLTGELGLDRKGYDIVLVLAVGPRGEKVVVEPADPDRGLAYWRDAEGVHHVPKLPLPSLLI